MREEIGINSVEVLFLGYFMIYSEPKLLRNFGTKKLPKTIESSVIIHTKVSWK